MKTVESINKPEENTIEACKQLLAEAEKGELVGLVYASVHGDGKCGHGSVGLISAQPNRLAGAIANGLLAYQLDHAVEYTPYEE